MSNEQYRNTDKRPETAVRRKRRSRREDILLTRLKAVFCMILFAFAVVVCAKAVQNLRAGGKKENEPQMTQMTENAAAKTTTTAPDAELAGKNANSETTPPVSEKEPKQQTEHKTEVIDGITYVDGVMIANKSYPLPESYDPGLLPETQEAFNKMAAAAEKDGIYLFISSGYRSHFEQKVIYDDYVYTDGKKAADTYSSRAGYSEHQTGYAIDVNNPSDSFRGTDEAKWIAEHCSDYGFIVRYPEGKEKITGYEYEPWHLRYLGKKLAKKVEASGLCLEEYLGIDSKYSK